MNGVARPVRRYSLGAEELIEMGRSDQSSKQAPRPDRRPYLSGRARRNALGAEELIEMGGRNGVRLGDMVDLTGNAAPFLAGALETALDTLSDLSGMPIENLAQGADVSRTVFTDLLRKVPALAGLYAEMLLAGAALVRFGLSVPGVTVRGLGNILAGLAGALGEVETDLSARVSDALKKLVSLVPQDLKADVKTVLESAGVSASDLAPRVDRETGLVSPEVAPQETGE